MNRREAIIAGMAGMTAAVAVPGNSATGTKDTQ